MNSSNTEPPSPEERLRETGHSACSGHSGTSIPPTDPVAEATQSAQETIRNFTDRALNFLSTASNETLGACLVGLGATTYIVLGRVGLVLIGIVGGVVLHATWDGHTALDEQSRAAAEKRRKETGLEIAHRVLSWRSSSKQDSAKDSDALPGVEVKLYAGKHLDYSSFRPETASALAELTDAVVRDYVKWWYSPILPQDESFPNACRQTLTAFILSASAHLSRKRSADAFLDFLTNSSSIVIVFLNELCSAMTTSPGRSASEAVRIYLEAKPNSNLAQILSLKHQERKLDMVAEDVLESFLEPKSYNCKPAHVFLREILAKVILEKTIQSCSNAEFINSWIVYLYEDAQTDVLGMGELGSSLLTGNQSPVDQPVTSPTTPGLEESKARANHKRVVSRAQEAMDEAMREAARLTQMIAEEDARRLREQQATEQQGTTGVSSSDDMSESTTQGIATPTSSQSDLGGDGEGAGAEVAPPLPPRTEPAAQEPPVSQLPKSSFTSFDQLVPVHPPTALSGSPEKLIHERAPLSLYNAKIAIFDDSLPGEKGGIRIKPVIDYLIQIEPSSSQHPGWMIVRKYADFETLHEILRRISVISGVGFTEAHSQLPNWKGHTKASLRGELERYLNDAIRWHPLAECEGMKRFLEKENAVSKSNSSSKGGFPGLGWPNPSAFETMGKGMMDVLTKAPKEVAGGGKAFFGGVSNVLGSVSPLGQKKTNTPRPNRSATSLSSIQTRPDSNAPSLVAARKSQDSQRNSPIVDMQPPPIPQMERRPSWNPDAEGEPKSRRGSSARSSLYAKPSREQSRASSIRESLDVSPVHGGDQIITLPPLPAEISDDYTSSRPPPPLPIRKTRQCDDADSHRRTSSVPPLSNHSRNPSPRKQPALDDATQKPASQSKTKPALTEQETQVAIELLFAVVNELYTLSSAWQIRKTLLTAAKTFLLRPGNPQLDSIRVLLQDTILDANTSDAGIAAHLRNLRKNALPTDVELKGWPKPRTEEEREKLRAKARKLLMERGMPQALTSVMGMVATAESLGKVFDCLQVEEVARGLMFGVLLQAVRAVTQ